MIVRICVVLFALIAINASGADESKSSPDVTNDEVVARAIRIRLPIIGSSDEHLKRSLDQMIESLPPSDQRPTFVLEFMPNSGTEGSGSSFERCLSLARYLTSKRFNRIRTVAYVPKAVTGHAVLVALACEEIVISPDAVFGDAGRDERSLGATVRRGYAEIAESKRTIPAAVALGMLDPDLQVLKANTNSGTLFLLAQDLEKERSARNIREVETVIVADQMGRFHGDQLRDLGFASYLVRDQSELAEALRIPIEYLDFDPSMGGGWAAIRVELHGPINTPSVDRVINAIQQQRELRSVNFVCVQIDSEGGSPVESVRLASFLSELDRSQVRTVAYVSQQARSDAALVAFACDHIVVHAEAVIGGDGAATIDEQMSKDLESPIREISVRKSRNWSIPLAFVDSNLQVYSYSKKDDFRRLYLCEEELNAKFGNDGEAPANTDWIRGDELTSDGEVLTLDGARARELGFARFQVESFDELKQLYQLEDAPELVGPNWAFELVEVLASPKVAAGLLFIGIFALYIELSSPGIGIGGFCSSICFLLYFWSNFMNGTAGALEIILFLTGLSFIALEIFVLPGFGIFGLGGGALVLASLVLATQTFVIPTNQYQMEQLPRSMLTVIGSFAACVVCLVLLQKHIQRVPVLGRLMLFPPDADDRNHLSQRESIVHYDHLVGQIGTTTTRLSPAGKAMFGDMHVDVVSDGEMIAKDSNVQVIQVFGNRVVVEPAGRV